MSETRPPTRPPADAPSRRASHTGLRLLAVAVVAVSLVVVVLTWSIRPEVGSRGFWLVVSMRVGSVMTIVVVAAAQSTATVLFHTATGNRILTPSIMGFDALYVLIQTSLAFFLGAQALSATDGIPKVLLQSAVMIAFATLLYGWLFGGRRGSLHVTLLVGLILGAGFGTLSSFMQRMLVPTDFDILSARLFGNISNANVGYLPVASAIIGAVLVIVHAMRFRLDVLALGRDTSIGLGLAHKRQVIAVLVLVAVLVSVSTTLIGPMTFFGFIVATLSYQLAGAHEHRRVLPFAFLLGTAILLGAYFVLHHLFRAAGLVTVIIEFVGGSAFVILLLRKGKM